MSDYVEDPSDGLPARRVGEWAHRKHYFVRRYMDAFTKAMKKWGELVYIDLFAGPGRCWDEKASPQFFPGSPLIALELPFTQHIYVEADPVAAAALRKRAAAASKRVDVIEDDCNDAVPTILELLPRRALSLTFIDPTNWQIRYDKVAELTAGRPMDLIVTFMVGGMKRVPLTASDEALDAFFGTDEWRRLEPRTQEAFVELYRKQLAKLGYIARPPRHDLVVTNTKNVPLYQLCFFSKNDAGYRLWDNVTGIDEKGQRRLGTG